MKLEEFERQIIFETNHWDRPLSGLARIDGQLYSFEASQWEEHEVYPVDYRVVPLHGYARFKALLDKRWFEFCIGTYWSYDRSTRDYHPSRPRWLNRLLWWLFYRQRPQ